MVRELRRITVTKTKEVMIYIDKHFDPVFRLLNKVRDRSKVIVYDHRKHAYTQRWLPTRYLQADDRTDLLKLQADPERYAPTLEDLHEWLEQHPHAR
jgi:hypothetical protein